MGSSSSSDMHISVVGKIERGPFAAQRPQPLGHAEMATRIENGQVRPAKETAKIAFSHAAQMAIIFVSAMQPIAKRL